MSDEAKKDAPTPAPTPERKRVEGCICQGGNTQPYCELCLPPVSTWHPSLRPG